MPQRDRGIATDSNQTPFRLDRNWQSPILTHAVSHIWSDRDSSNKQIQDLLLDKDAKKSYARIGH